LVLQLQGHIISATFYDSNTHYFREGDGAPTYLTINATSSTFSHNVNITGSALQIKNAGDTYLILEADSDNDGEDDNPTIQLYQDGRHTCANVGLDGINRLKIDISTIGTSSVETYIDGINVLSLTSTYSTFSQNVNISGDLTVGGSLNLDDLEISGDLNVDEDAQIEGNLVLNGDGTVPSYIQHSFRSDCILTNYSIMFSEPFYGNSSETSHFKHMVPFDIDFS
jgi:hypothetical protein